MTKDEDRVGVDGDDVTEITRTSNVINCVRPSVTVRPSVCHTH